MISVLIAEGIQCLVPAGWQLTAIADDQATCYEIELSKGEARVGIEIISSSNLRSVATFFDAFRFELLANLKLAGCQIDPPDPNNHSWITAHHNDLPGHILHFVKPGCPVVHLSAASITTDQLEREVKALAISIELDSQYWERYWDKPLGEVLPIVLTKPVWERQ